MNTSQEQTVKVLTDEEISEMVKVLTLVERGKLKKDLDQLWWNTCRLETAEVCKRPNDFENDAVCKKKHNRAVRKLAKSREKLHKMLILWYINKIKMAIYYNENTIDRVLDGVLAEVGREDEAESGIVRPMIEELNQEILRLENILLGESDSCAQQKIDWCKRKIIELKEVLPKLENIYSSIIKRQEDMRLWILKQLAN